MNILFVTSECAPWVKTGGLGDVSSALPRALAQIGHDVKLLIPAYGALIDLLPAGKEVAKISALGVWPEARLVACKDKTNVTLLLLDCPELFEGTGGPYVDAAGRDHANSAKRFAFLGLIAAQIASSRSPLENWKCEVLHCNDWPSALAPAWLHGMQAHDQIHRAPSVITIHNLAYQGQFPMETIDDLDLPEEWRSVDGAEFWGQMSFLKAGLQYADAITTVSPTYAREITREALGCGLDGLLRAKRDRLQGILNGVDTNEWNPATDVHLGTPYDASTLQGKRANKRALQQRMGLTVSDERMLFGVVGRLVSQKGIDLIAQAVPWVIANDCQLVMLGTGDSELESLLKSAALSHPESVAVNIGFSEELAHQIEAGADTFLMPSRYEPCGLNQMYSQIYGTLPVVHATGGLADSVVDFLDDSSTGFSMPDASLPALIAAMSQALLVYRQPKAWTQMQQRAMSMDFAWNASARKYVALYQSLMSKPGSSTPLVTISRPK